MLRPATVVGTSTSLPTPVPTPAPTRQAEPVNEAKQFIYRVESGNRPHAVNPYGCIGLGQACPGGAKSDLIASCPDWATNYDCQDRFFTRYMQKRYGSWEHAKAFWLAKMPIAGRDVGNWW